MWELLILVSLVWFHINKLPLKGIYELLWLVSCFSSLSIGKNVIIGIRADKGDLRTSLSNS